ncbi:hypothetical protein BHM03_00037783 [Ensete ventricosum]|nr:hypothetical protein BHM03_00037783 [Ensete ventricosum]
MMQTFFSHAYPSSCSPQRPSDWPRSRHPKRRDPGHPNPERRRSTQRYHDVPRLRVRQQALAFPLHALQAIPGTLDEVQSEFMKSKEELGECSKGRSSFVLEIQEKPIQNNFRLPALESYDGSSDPSEQIATFRA